MTMYRYRARILSVAASGMNKRSLCKSPWPERRVGDFNANVDYLQTECGVTVFVVHHCGKDKAQGERGSTAI